LHHLAPSVPASPFLDAVADRRPAYPGAPPNGTEERQRDGLIDVGIPD
jgi:hypothetical protein